jgi:multiple sugar transport system permease protein
MKTSKNQIKQSKGGLAIGKQRFVLSVIIPILCYLSFTVFLLGFAFALMFFNYSPGRLGGPILGFGGSNPFIGFNNFIEMFSGSSVKGALFRTSLVNTLVFAFAVLPLNLVITLLLAYLLESIGERFKSLYRIIYFLPVLTSSVGVALIWISMYNTQGGWLNAVIRFFGGNPVAWLQDSHAGFLGISIAMWSIIIAYLWQDYGYNMIIFIAALQAIPQGLKDAAMIDGATAWQLFRKITFPLIRPTLLFVCVMTMLSSFQVFDIIQVMTPNGGPAKSTQVLMLDIYQNAFRYQSLGFAAAESFVLFLIMLVITIFQMRILRTNWEY